MAKLWSEQHRLDRMLEIEVLVCRALADQGVVPESAARRIEQRAKVDAKRVAEIGGWRLPQCCTCGS